MKAQPAFIKFVSLTFVAGCLVLLTGCPAPNNPTPVFETDFGANNLVKFGGTAALTTGGMVSISTNYAFENLGGFALYISNCCPTCEDCVQQQSNSIGLNVQFATNTNSLASMFHTNRILSGAIDFFVMAGTSTNLPSEQPDHDDCRCLDQCAMNSDFRFVIRGQSGTNGWIDAQFISYQTNALLIGGFYTNDAATPKPPNKKFFSPGEPYHVAVTLQTSAITNVIYLWVKEGTGAIDTTSPNNAYSSIQFGIDTTRLSPQAYMVPFGQNSTMVFGVLNRSNSPEPILFRKIRIWSSVPDLIPGL